jgi:hypothetical protein
VGVKAASDHDVEARFLGDARKVSDPASDPDDGQIDDPGPAVLADGLELADRQFGIVHHEVVLKTDEVPANEAEVLDGHPWILGRVLPWRREPDSTIDQAVLVHACRAQLARVNHAQNRVDRHLPPSP